MWQLCLVSDRVLVPDVVRNFLLCDRFCVSVSPLLDHLPCLAVLMATTFVRFETIASDAAARCSGTLARAHLAIVPTMGFLR
jgi:hypothetical protein